MLLTAFVHGTMHGSRKGAKMVAASGLAPVRRWPATVAKAPSRLIREGEEKP
jgi:hypothetical protein